MSKTPAKPPARRKEVVIEPKKSLVSREATKLRGGDPAAGRILAEESVAKRQAAKRYGKKKP